MRKAKSRVYRASRRARLPPHSNEAYAQVSSQDARKPFTIGVIAVVLLVALALLLFFANQFVGQAVEFGDLPLVIERGEEFTLPINVDLEGAESVAVRFRLDFDPALRASCDLVLEELDRHFVVGKLDTLNLAVPENNDLWVVRESECGAGFVQVEYVGLCNEDCSNALEGQMELVRINMVADRAGEFEFEFNYFEMLSLADNRDLGLTIPQRELIVRERAQCALDSDCGAGQICKEGVCVLGAPLSGGRGVLECVLNSDCGAGQICKEGVCVLGGLSSPLPAGAVPECALDAECGAGEICVAGICELENQGQEPRDDGPLPLENVPNGGKCSSDDECLNGFCSEGLLGNQGYCCGANSCSFEPEDDACVNQGVVYDEVIYDLGIGNSVCWSGVWQADDDLNGIPNHREGLGAGRIVVQLVDEQGSILAPVAQVNKGESYTIRAIISAREEFDANHLAIVRVSYGDVQRTYLADRKAVLVAGDQEEVSFVHTVPADVQEDLRVNVFVWNQWPAGQGEFRALLGDVEVTYGVSNN
jgi:hypothetical protein